MINNVILVGTIINEVKLNVVGEYEVCTIVLKVQRPFRDMETNEYKSEALLVTIGRMPRIDKDMFNIIEIRSHLAIICIKAWLENL